MTLLGLEIDAIELEGLDSLSHSPPQHSEEEQSVQEDWGSPSSLQQQCSDDDGECFQMDSGIR